MEASSARGPMPAASSSHGIDINRMGSGAHMAVGVPMPLISSTVGPVPTLRT